MEGAYFFGEHLRWNLGWSNPNQGGAFIAMLIPWLWACPRRPSGGSSNSGVVRWLLLLVELGLWFLVCKTYSRGAIVAVGVSGIIYFLWDRHLNRGRTGGGLMLTRLAGIGVLLVATGFFARIDPRFVTQDASAGNRLVLWKGGLQMIAASPWRGWGAGRSGEGFMHWFQALESKQEYAGMVNSYLHVGVEYGLPVLAGVMAVLLALVVLAFSVGWIGKPTAGIEADGEVPAARGPMCFAAAAGTSLLVFLIANVFSTLWIFKNLWWLPGFAGLVILIAGFHAQGRTVAAVCDRRSEGTAKNPCGSVAAVCDRRWLSGGILTTGFHAQGLRFIRCAATTMAATTLLSAIMGLGLHLAGKAAPGEVVIRLNPDSNTVSCHANGNTRGEVLIYPDRSVLGRDWGKEIRRLATLPQYRDFGFCAAMDGHPLIDGGLSAGNPKGIVACGAQAPSGFAALARFPASRLVIVHPLGKPMPSALPLAGVAVILPMLDTSGNGRTWRAACKKRGWPCLTSPGVGQDVRLVWPEVLSGVF